MPHRRGKGALCGRGVQRAHRLERILRNVPRLCRGETEIVLRDRGYPPLYRGHGGIAYPDIAGNVGHGQNVACVRVRRVSGEHLDGHPRTAHVERKDGPDRLLQRIHQAIQRNGLAEKDIRGELQRADLYHGAGRNEHRARGILFCGVFVAVGTAERGRTAVDGGERRMEERSETTERRSRAAA